MSRYRGLIKRKRFLTDIANNARTEAVNNM
jgi:hypothetical protein